MQNDLISREALLEWLTSVTGFRANCEDCCEVDCLNCIIDEAIKNASAVDAEPVKHGRWVADEVGLDEDGNGQYRCSCCGVGEKHNPTVTVSYCWNCGAKMDDKTNI